MAIDSQNTMDHQSPVDRTKHRGLIDPTCIFDPDIILLPSQQEGFRLLFPDWGEKSILDRPTIIEMQRMLKGVDLTKITKRSVILADYALTPSPNAPSTQKDSTRYREYSRIPLDAQPGPTSWGTMDTKTNGRAFEARQGQKVTVNDIIGVAQYLKGCIATSKGNFYGDNATGLLATRLTDIQFAFVPNERETLKESLCKAQSGGVQDNMDAAEAILVAVDFQHYDDGDDSGGFVSRAGFYNIDFARNYIMFEDYKLEDADIKTVENWLSGSIQSCVLCEIIARHLFGYSGYERDQIALDGTIKDAVVLSLFGRSKPRKLTFPKRKVTLEELIAKGYNIDIYDIPMFSVNDDHKVSIGKFSYTQMCITLCLWPDRDLGDTYVPCPMQDLLRIYAGLFSTPSSFKLAVDMGIIDYDNFTAVKRALTDYSIRCASDAVTSQHGYEYAKLCYDFHSWRKKIMRAASHATCW
ncbi:hypothetical protein BC940DRAFT_299296 [Gongronella butleri]|nr:hypothetical protein BC940DRAFT_299296 [Gongronella butleri]